MYSLVWNLLKILIIQDKLKDAGNVTNMKSHINSTSLGLKSDKIWRNSGITKIFGRISLKKYSHTMPL